MDNIISVNPNIIEDENFSPRDVLWNNVPRMPYRFLDLVDVQNIGKRTYKGKKEFVPFVRQDEKWLELMNKSIAYLVKLNQQNISIASADTIDIDFEQYYWDSGDLSYIQNIWSTIKILQSWLYKIEFATTLVMDKAFPITWYTVFVESSIGGPLLNRSFWWTTANISGTISGTDSLWWAVTGTCNIQFKVSETVQYKSEQGSAIYALQAGEILKLRIYVYTSWKIIVLGWGETYLGVEIKKFSWN